MTSEVCIFIGNPSFSPLAFLPKGLVVLSAESQQLQQATIRL